MKSMLVTVLLVAVSAVLGYRYYFGNPGRGEEEGGPAAAQVPVSGAFLRSCRAASAAQSHPEAYCRCLWRSGIRNLAKLAMSVEAQKQASRCAEAMPSGAAP
jgi:hypothetical protein